MKQRHFTDICAIGFAIVALSILAGCGSGRAVNENPDITLRTEVYGETTTSSLILDTRLRSARPTQTQGTIASLRVGSEMRGVMDILILDSGVVYNDSIPIGATPLACTLWLQINQIPHFDGDSAVIDLWSVPENWVENEANWNERQNAVAWSSSGGFGELVAEKLIVARRIDLNRFSWTINGVLYDTVDVYPSRYLPAPIDTTLFEQNLNGGSFGFALRTNQATTPGASFAIFSSETLIESSRPFIAWVYGLPIP